MRIPLLWSSLLALLCVTGANAQYSPSEKASVQLSCVAQASPARITLNWPAYTGATGYTIYRKLHTATSWGASIGTTNGSTNTYADNTAVANTLYEYKVTRSSPDGTGYGYACSAIELQPTEYNGKVVLLVDATIAAGISAELTQLQNDLKADGWVVLRHDIASGTAVTSVRNTIITDYNADPTNVKSVYVVGHVPVPYSGNIAPDGHTDQHQGAWPCDGYYADVNGTWTDNTVNNVTGWTANRNSPGDGKFDQNSPPTNVELQIGRVDLSDMTYFSQSYTQLTSAYLTKAHNFRTRAYIPQTRGIIRDHLEDITTPLAGTAWMSIPPLVGTANMTEVAYNAGTWLEDLVNNQSYLWTYGSGGGLLANDNGQLIFYWTEFAANSQLLPNLNFDGVFNMLMGSYVGDWDNRNNVMRAVIASGHALSCVYSGPPNWWFHPMGMGKTIGYCTALTMNNTTLYLPQSGSDVNPAPRAHLGLMGDPTLRQLYVDMPSNLSVTNNAGNAAFSWNAAAGAPAGYHVYKFDANGVPSRVNTNLITGTSFNSAQALAAGTQYMVRAVKLQTTASGSYYDLSLGAMATATNNLVQVAPRAFLEGPYNTGTGLMNDALRVAGLVPTTEPYSALGFTQAAGGGGETVSAAVLNTTGNNAVVDWVHVELRNASTPSTIMATRQGLLQSDGDIVATDGTSALSFNVAPGNYYVAVRHRNHLGAMTGAAIALTANSTTVDLTTAATSTYGTVARKAVGSIQALYAGNALLNPQLAYTGANNDRDPILTRVGSATPTTTVNGYYLEDVTLDGQVKYTGTGNDRDPILVNVGGGTPNATRPEQLP